MSLLKTYSVVIPVYKSELVVEKTVSETLRCFDEHNINGEILLINDGSPDNSWEVISNIAQREERVKAINFLRNYGQHTAVYCGIAESVGDFVITMDDDLQNPPNEILKLISKIDEGYDLVFAEFKQKMHGGFRKLGTKVIGYLNAQIFGKPKDLKLTNFRIFTRETANRMLTYRTNYPYIPGLLLMHASKITNVETEHHARKIGTSNYTFTKILMLVARLLFNYSSYPLKASTSIGMLVSVLSFFSGAFYMIRSLYFGVAVAGWTTIVVLLSFLCGFIIIMLGIMGEYMARIMNQISSGAPYQIRERVG